MKLMILIFLLSLQSFAQNAKDSAFVDNQLCPQQISESRMLDLIKKTQEKFFPELKDVSISIVNFESKNYFFQAQPKIESILNKRQKRKYHVMVNTKIYKCSPSSAALEGILVHELQHILDYHQKAFGRLVGFARKYSFNKKFQLNYEQLTDIKTIQRGAATGLAEFRTWVYTQLTQKQVERKALEYLTPVEIEYIDKHQHELFEN
jgi:hypothetical protein